MCYYTCMPQVAIYIDEETAAKLDEAVKRDCKSRSAWVSEAIKDKLQDRRKEQLLALFGSWEDDRSAEEILRDIKDLPEQRERAQFE
jgi:predicted transcriptional regulator